ncbi:6-phosphogluconate dehydrogenase [Cavenderia fasciculata]|uniref:6-phosphogluconate dehydrogenase, decarboxylating n=1 Tax=Cavenderia fasciculata TaxID=261658 RepID=F4PS83_CACFS|nr:6-phosphogluconate dehydrogenase [Cavenderia fasciculata]EGG21466.1 6-phosphogluconate dehydrogenase [Cavenderia fasciculata]|eukprot:XP_004359316.1 6-phosphogluconate dehydrogenase [Cavenderia fasciculata]
MHAVEFITCKHLTEEKLVEQCLDIDIFDGADLKKPVCFTCLDETENWICLKCGVIGCSRHVAGHAAQHYLENAEHSLSASFSDLSVWCYECDAYVTAPCLAQFLEILGIVKFAKEKNDHLVKQAEKIEELDNNITTATTTTSTTTAATSTTSTTNDNISTISTTSTTSTTSSSTFNKSSSSPQRQDRHDISQDLNLDESSESEDESLKSEKGGILKAMMDMLIGSKPSSPGQILSSVDINGIANHIKSGKAKNIIVLTGAGISVAAGIPDFRSPKTGLYQNLAKYNLPYKTAIFDMEYFVENPKPFFILAKELYPGSFNPTPVHHFIKLLSDKGLLLRNYTQNIDTLERVAKIDENYLVEAHGTFASAKCIKCKKVHSCEYVKDIVFADEIPTCQDCSAVVKPDIVFFGESLPSRFSTMVQADFPKCDLMIVIGTSLQVQPFASLVAMAPANTPRLLINNEEVGISFKFDEPSNKLDCKWIGDCQDGINELTTLLDFKIMSSDIGLIGLAVMGENLVLNMESHGFTVSVFNRTVSKVDEFVQGRGKGKKFVGCHSIEQLVNSLKSPRRIMLMVKAGEVVDHFINQVVPFLSKGDIIIDGGNSLYTDTDRRVAELEKKGILYVGSGVSGGEEGALLGPSIMPGGNPEAWEHVKPIFQGIAAKVEGGQPCCDWVGDGGAGHYVKMVHNGIEYGDMQLISEAYFILKNYLGLSNEEMQQIFKEWNKGILDSYLIEITADILGKKDEETGKYVVDEILDSAGQKGTGKWTAINALDLGMPVTLIGEAVFSRCLSSLKDERVAASKVLPGPKSTACATAFKGDKKEVIEWIRQALFASKLVSYAQGFTMMKAAAKEYKWRLNYGNIALLWRGGCIIRSTFLGRIKDAFERNPNLDNLLVDQWFTEQLSQCQNGWRQVASVCMLHGIPAPAFTTALSYYDGYRCELLPANILQAQRDYFGAHTYEKLNGKRGEVFHTNWTGRGGSTHSTSYNV